VTRDVMTHIASMTIDESRAWRPQIPGWSDDILPFYRWASERLRAHGTMVEIGVFLGRSLAYMAYLRPDVRVVGVDPWDDVSPDPSRVQGYQGPGEHADYVRSNGGTLWDAFVRTMREHAPDEYARMQIVRGTSLDLLRYEHDTLRGTVDMVYIDGAHDYASVRTDITVARRLVRAGGIIAGHDYNPEYDPSRDGADDGRAGVIVAAHELASALGRRVNLMGTCWWVET
jgi:hypothetical protein